MVGRADRLHLDYTAARISRVPFLLWRPERDPDGVDAIARAQLTEGIVQMQARRDGGDAQFVSDRLVGHAAHEQAQNFGLPRRQSK